ncbi:pimeloyl-ACP methyl ester carboxylesterase [Rhodococcus sp. LBL1]|nr:pimeloyl-ACP methyl ester carboxylesterase [Rhodococcus sp. LBL1]MDH6681825.1 pimeloyl-ACP methyl ester carboxylesterase [Rhodococcus sp. LBL2]
MTANSISHTVFGEGTPIVMIHGYTVDHRLLLPLEPVFAQRPDFQRFYLDLPGHGNSPRLSGQTSALRIADVIFDWITANLGDRPFAVVGQSFGGQIARAVTARFGSQVLGSALLAPVVRWGEERTLPSEVTIEHDEVLLNGLPAPERDLFRVVMAHLDQPRWEVFSEYLLPGWHAHDRSAAAELEAEFLLPQAPESQAPIHQGRHLLVAARQDALVGWQDQLRLLHFYPRMTAAVIDGAGHNPQLEAPEIVRDLIADWLDAVPSDGIKNTQGGGAALRVGQHF